MYERFAAEYLEHAEDGAWNAWYDRPAVLALLGDVDGLTVLDAACGPGLYAAELVDRGAQVVGFDQSPAMVGLAEEQTDGRADLRVHDLADPLDWLDDASVDRVVLALALAYVDDRVGALRELRRVLRPAGAAVVSVQHPTADWLRRGGPYLAVERVRESLSPTRDWPVDVWHLPLQVVHAEFRAAGFVVDELVEPTPVPGTAERWPEDHARLSTSPGFLAVRLVSDGRSSA